MAILLSGWASRNKYAIMSSARVVSQNVAYEIPMLLVVITLLLATGTMDLGEIVRQQAGGFWHWNFFRVWINPLMPVTFVIFFICMLAEANRSPFDMAEAESELVAGAFTEYAGMGFGVFFMAEYANIVLGCSLATVLFLGGWQTGLGAVPACLVQFQTGEGIELGYLGGVRVTEAAWLTVACRNEAGFADLGRQLGVVVG